MIALGEAAWEDIERFRLTVGAGDPSSMELAAADFVAAFCGAFSDVVLARLFVVVPFKDVPSAERDFATRIAGGGDRLTADSKVLTLLGSNGREASWKDRRQSRGHLCIPLLDRASVDGAPMIAKLLADIDVDLAALDDGRPIATRRLLGGKNGMFYVPDAATARDERNRYVIADRAFVQKYAVQTVFGMGGAYLDGTIIVAIVFAANWVPRAVVDRFPSLIVNFKMATASLVENRHIFDEARQRQL